MKSLLANLFGYFFPWFVSFIAYNFGDVFFFRYVDILRYFLKIFFIQAFPNMTSANYFLKIDEIYFKILLYQSEWMAVV